MYPPQHQFSYRSDFSPPQPQSWSGNGSFGHNSPGTTQDSILHSYQPSYSVSEYDTYHVPQPHLYPSRSWTPASAQSSLFHSPTPEPGHQRRSSRLDHAKGVKRKSAERTGPRKCLSFETRAQICEYKESFPNSTQAMVGRHFGVERSTISKTLKFKDDYLGNKTGSKSEMKKPKGKFKDAVKTLANWAKNKEGFNEQHCEGEKLSDEEILRQARLFASGTNENVDPRFINDLNDPAWLEAFKKEYSVGIPNNVKMSSPQTTQPSLAPSPPQISPLSYPVKPSPSPNLDDAAPSLLKVQASCRNDIQHNHQISSIAAPSFPESTTYATHPVVYDYHHSLPSAHPLSPMDTQIRNQTYYSLPPMHSDMYHHGYAQSMPPPPHYHTQPPVHWHSVGPRPPAYPQPVLLPHPSEVPQAHNDIHIYSSPEQNQTTPNLSYVPISPTATMSLSPDGQYHNPHRETPSIAQAEAAMETIKKFCATQPSRLTQNEVQVICGLDTMALRPPIEAGGEQMKSNHESQALQTKDDENPSSA